MFHRRPSTGIRHAGSRRRAMPTNADDELMIDPNGLSVRRRELSIVEKEGWPKEAAILLHLIGTGKR